MVKFLNQEENTEEEKKKKPKKNLLHNETTTHKQKQKPPIPHTKRLSKGGKMLRSNIKIPQATNVKPWQGAPTDFNC